MTNTETLGIIGLFVRVSSLVVLIVSLAINELAWYGVVMQFVSILIVVLGLAIRNR